MLPDKLESKLEDPNIPQEDHLEMDEDDLQKGKDEAINLNVNLVKTPDDIIDYIVIHELCHFVIKGHSHPFWNYLKRYVPDYHQKIKWLEKNSSNLISQKD